MNFSFVGFWFNENWQQLRNVFETPFYTILFFCSGMLQSKVRLLNLCVSTV